MGTKELQKQGYNITEVGRDIEIYNRNGVLVAAIFGRNMSAINPDKQGGVPVGNSWFARNAASAR